MIEYTIVREHMLGGLCKVRSPLATWQSVQHIVHHDHTRPHFTDHLLGILGTRCTIEIMIGVLYCSIAIVPNYTLLGGFFRLPHLRRVMSVEHKLGAVLQARPRQPALPPEVSVGYILYRQQQTTG